jgi:hypothetical protein
VLLEATTGVDSHDLESTANAEHWKVAVERTVDQGQFGVIAVATPPGRFRMWLLAVQLGVQVSTTGKQ